jgi:epoxyqueuosine reductase
MTQVAELADLLALDDTAFRTLFAGSAIKRIGVKRFIRNCLYAAGNSGSAELRPAVVAHLASKDAVVADAAAWAMAQLEGTA